MKTINRRTAIVSTATALGSVALAAKAIAQAPSARPAMVDAAKHPEVEKIAPYQPRFGRSRPLVAVVALNEGTIISDFAIPFGVMARSQVADVVSVSVRPGAVRMRDIINGKQVVVNHVAVSLVYQRQPVVYG